MNLKILDNLYYTFLKSKDGTSKIFSYLGGIILLGYDSV